ncbi:unnamed protein product [Lactuca virosa]|uniref:Uncharacterized protein n=1 Tax=Lactuca virosa TaxID=75947 RepID=A0AAU9NUR5_9ASTR|nr:unnamed protein product [Lactuca virosa]
MGGRTSPRQWLHQRTTPTTVGSSIGDAGGVGDGESEGEGAARPRTTAATIGTFPRCLSLSAAWSNNGAGCSGASRWLTTGAPASTETKEEIKGSFSSDCWKTKEHHT